VWFPFSGRIVFLPNYQIFASFATSQKLRTEVAQWKCVLVAIDVCIFRCPYLYYTLAILLPRDAMHSDSYAVVRFSPVRPSYHSFAYSVETAKRITIWQPHHSSFYMQNIVAKFRRNPLRSGVKCRWGIKNHDFQPIYRFISKTTRERRHCDKKLARHLFDFRVIPQQLSTQRTMSVSNKFRLSQSVDKFAVRQQSHYIHCVPKKYVTTFSMIS